MTVPATPRRAGPYAGNNVTTVFPFSFQVFGVDDVSWSLTTAAGNTTDLIRGTHYSVTLNSDQDSNPGGSINYPLSGSPLATGDTLVGVGALPYDQVTDLPPGGPYRATVVEQTFDRTVFQVQQLVEVLDRALVFSPSDPTGSTLPPASSRADRLLGFDSLGRILLSAPVSGSASALALDLANTSDSTKGDALLGVKQPFTGAFARTQHDKNAEFVSIKDFGAVGDGVTDDTAALTAALAASKHVVVPSGLTPLISSTVTVPVATRLQFLGGLGNTNSAYPASYLVKKSTMTTTALILSDRALVDGGGLICQVGNTGDGVAIQGNNAKIRDFLVHKAGGVGVRVGTDAGGNYNSFQLEHVTSQYNGGHGFYIHDGKLNIGADANAGTLTQCFAQYNTGDGFRLGHCFWVTVLNCLSEVNTGYGLYLSGANDGTGVPQCRYATILGGDYNEGNVAGQVFDQGYFSNWLNPDPASCPTTASSGLTGSAARNVIGSQGANNLTGLTVTTRSNASPLIVDDGTSGGSTYQTLKKVTTGTNGDALGWKISLSNGGGFVDAAIWKAYQVTASVYGAALYCYRAGASTLGLNIDANGLGVLPGADNTWSCGSSGTRWSVVYAATGTINTSDRETKQDIAALTEAEAAVARDLKGLIRTFRFKDAFAAKGDAARIHVGAIAQDVRDAFQAHGLDPTRYALFCSDTWHELDGQIVLPDESGSYPDGTCEVTRLGLRYEELLAFIIAAL